ncbi:MAG: metallophosphoesterase [bacterium]
MFDRNFVLNDFKITRRRFLTGTAAFGFISAFSGMDRVYAAMAPPPENAVATVPILETREKGQFKILAVTDMHLHFMMREILLDTATIKNIVRMAEIFKPDLIVNTGDFWINNEGGLGADFCKWCCKEFSKVKTPWAFAWGNHDEADDYNKCHAILEDTPFSLYRGGAADGNYRIEVRDKGIERPIWNLIFLNNSRGGFKQEQIDWLSAEVTRIKKGNPEPPPAFLFFHIPLPQYDDVVTAGLAKGVKFEKVCHENAPRDAFTAFKESSIVRATFCGHDHLNDYFGVLDGIHLAYIRASGVGGYGGDKVRKGGTLITADAAGTFKTASVFPDGTMWTAEDFITVPQTDRIY